MTTTCALSRFVRRDDGILNMLRYKVRFLENVERYKVRSLSVSSIFYVPSGSAPIMFGNHLTAGAPNWKPLIAPSPTPPLKRIASPDRPLGHLRTKATRERTAYLCGVSIAYLTDRPIDFINEQNSRRYRESFNNLFVNLSARNWIYVIWNTTG